MLGIIKDSRFTKLGQSQSLPSRLTGYLILDRFGNCRFASKTAAAIFNNPDEIICRLPMVKDHLDRPETPGTFYRHQSCFDADSANCLVYVGPGPDFEEIVIAAFEGDIGFENAVFARSDVFILSLITSAIRAFNEADDLEDILRIILIGVTAGSGLGLNRAFIFLTGVMDESCCLVGTHAIGPSSPEEAGAIWGKLTSGELTLEMMFNDVLQKQDGESQPIEGVIRDLKIPLSKKDNIFAKAALERKSMLIDETILDGEEYSDLRRRLGHGPMAVVPLVGKESLQGVLVADNIITRKSITESDIQLLEIFARYASDSIEKFRLYESLERKVADLKRANEMIILSRENLIKAERLSVLAEMAGQVAHEVRNPLTVIGGFAKSMLRKMPPDHDNFEYLNIIAEQANRIEHALDKFTSLMNYQKKMDKVCDLSEIVRSTLDLRQPDKCNCRFEIKSNEPITVKADPDLLRQALMLIINKAGSILDRQEKISLTIVRADTKSLIYFEPLSGNADYAEALHKDFHLGGNHESRRELAIALEILKYYGGNVGLEARGSDSFRFYIEVPFYEEEK